MTKAKSSPLPTKRQIIDFIRESPVPVGKREIARAFRITGTDWVALKVILQELRQDGEIERGRGRRVAPPNTLPEVAVVVIDGVDADGEVVARPATWSAESDPPRIFMAPERRGHPALGEGERALARLRRLADGTYEGRTIRKLGTATTRRIVGVFRGTTSGGIVEPADRRRSDGVFVAAGDCGGAVDGELVVAELPPPPRNGPRPARIVDRLGDADDPRSISLIAIHAAGIPTEFPSEALRQAEAAAAPSLNGRVDLRDLPLVTIDGADARDFDDAVWAEPDADPANPGGWHLVVAIADVAAYVAPGTALDREAFKRGNSSYFPDRVVPMLPEALSNGLCSLKPAEDRACIAAHLWIDGAGRLRRHRFARGLMRSAARLTYEQVQAARNGQADDATAPLLDTVVAPLYGAFRALQAARAARGTLDLDLPERQIRLADSGAVAAIAVRVRLDSHRLIEEFMIAANVAAAETLEQKATPCLFRVHDAPDNAKVAALREFLEPLGYRLAKGQVMRPRVFMQILTRARGRPEAAVVNEMILRSQAQAAYAPSNIGHFGLALPRYAHFTSPIRRYADLTVHRGLIRQLRLGPGGGGGELARLDEIGQHVSFTERRAAGAERDAVDRFTAGFLADQVGADFAGRISGVTRFGLFVALSATGADGLVPISTLPDDFYEHDARQHALIGQRWGRTYRLGAAVRVRLMEADPLTGGTIFRLLDDDAGADPPWLPRPGHPVRRSDPRGGRRPAARASKRSPGRK